MKIIDLGKDLYPGMEVFPGDPEYKIEKIHNIENRGWNLAQISMGLHTGSHVDAPYHMDEAGSTIDQIPLESFITKAIKTKDLESLDENLGLLLDFSPGPEMVEKIISKRPKFVGGDLEEEAERAFLKAGIITYTDLENLDLLPSDEVFLFIGLPLKIKGGDGSPIRPVAILDFRP